MNRRQFLKASVTIGAVTTVSGCHHFLPKRPPLPPKPPVRKPKLPAIPLPPKPPLP